MGYLNEAGALKLDPEQSAFLEQNKSLIKQMIDKLKPAPKQEPAPAVTE